MSSQMPRSHPFTWLCNIPVSVYAHLKSEIFKKGNAFGTKGEINVVQ